MKPGAWRTEVSVAPASRSTSSSWLAGSTVKTFMSVTGGLFMRLPASIAALRPCYAKRHSGTPNDEVERPDAGASSATRAQNRDVRSRSAQQGHSRPAPTEGYASLHKVRDY